MFLNEWRNKPKNDELILLEVQPLSDYNGQRAWQSPHILKEDKMACVYNCETDRVSDKSVYLDKDGREYINNKSKKYYLDDFDIENK